MGNFKFETWRDETRESDPKLYRGNHRASQFVMRHILDGGDEPVAAFYATWRVRAWSEVARIVDGGGILTLFDDCFWFVDAVRRDERQCFEVSGRRVSKIKSIPREEVIATNGFYDLILNDGQYELAILPNFERTTDAAKAFRHYL